MIYFSIYYYLKTLCIWQNLFPKSFVITQATTNFYCLNQEISFGIMTRIEIEKKYHLHFATYILLVLVEKEK